MTVLLRKLAGFSGLLHENMYRFTGWRFLEIGRAAGARHPDSRALAWLADPEAPDGALDMMLEIGDSVMTHRRHYTVRTSRRTVVDLLALDPLNPRSVLFHLDEVLNHVDFLPAAEVNGQRSPLSRATLQAHTGLAVRTPETVDGTALRRLVVELEGVSNLVSETYLR